MTTRTTFTALRLAALAVVLVGGCVEDSYLGYWADKANLAGAPTGGAQDASTAAADERDASSAAAAGVSGGALAGASAPDAVVNTEDAGAELTDAAGMVGDAAISPSACAQLADDGVCDLGGGVILPEELTLVEVERAVYFAAGASLPAGRYRLAYVDGCRRFVPTNGGWTVHGSVLTISGTSACWAVDGAGEQIVMTPGTAGFLAGQGVEPYGAFATYPECVAANCALAPVEFDFAGGMLGLLDTGDTNPSDDERGEAAGGRSPTFRLTRLDACP